MKACASNKSSHARGRLRLNLRTSQSPRSRNISHEWKMLLRFLKKRNCWKKTPINELTPWQPLLVIMSTANSFLSMSLKCMPKFKRKTRSVGKVTNAASWEALQTCSLDGSEPLRTHSHMTNQNVNAGPSVTPFYKTDNDCVSNPFRPDPPKMKSVVEVRQHQQPVKNARITL